MRNLFRKEPPYITVPGRPRSQRAGAQRRSTADGLWVRCENERCRELLYVREFENNLKVCHKCEHHARLAARERIAAARRRRLVCRARRRPGAGRPARLRGRRRKLSAAGWSRPRRRPASAKRPSAASATHRRRAARAGGARLRLHGRQHGQRRRREDRPRRRPRRPSAAWPLVTVSASGGARMHEGIFSLMQMAKTVAALASLGAARAPHISILADPTLGGVTASYAGVGDVILAEQGALVGFAGPRVIEQITKQKLPPDAQRAAFLLEHGMVDLVVQRRELRPTLSRLLRLYAGVARPCRRAGAAVSSNGPVKLKPQDAPQPAGLGARPARAPPAATVHARLPAAGVFRLPRAARRPPVRRRRGHRRRAGGARRDAR